MIPRPAFFDNAACRRMDPNLFMPERTQPQKTKQAKAVCATCPVQDDCLTYSLELAAKTDLIGIFAGYTKHERNKMLKNGGIRPTTRTHEEAFPHGTVAGYNRHRRNLANGVGPGPCNACRDAWASYSLRKRAERKRRKKAQAA